VPAVLHEWRDMLVRHFGTAEHVVVEPGVKTGVPVLMDNPREVGTDRIANALAAVHRYGAPCLVVDVGTAITIDVVSPAGAFIGELAFLRRQVASATVTLEPGTRYVEWPTQSLEALLGKSPGLRTSVDALFNADMAEKVARA